MTDQIIVKKKPKKPNKIFKLLLQSHLYIVYMKELFSAELDRYPEEVL